MTQGKFITLEGGEGAGKSTQIKALAGFLRAKGQTVVQTREVGGTVSSEAIRDLWLTKGEGFWDAQTELLLIMAARREHLVKTIWPALARGDWVISDRFVDSTRAYQGIGMGIGLDFVDHLYTLIADDFEPDLTLLLDVPVTIGRARMTSRGGSSDRYEQRDDAFHQKLRDAYGMLAKQDAQRFRVIDAARDAATVAAEIERITQEHFAL